MPGLLRFSRPGQWDGVPVVPRGVPSRPTDHIWAERALWLYRHGPPKVRKANSPSVILPISGGAMDVSGTSGSGDGIAFSAPHTSLKSTWCCWVNPDTITPGYDQRFMFLGDDNSTGTYIYRTTLLNTSGNLRIEGNGSDAGGYNQDVAAFVAGQWSAIVHSDASASSHTGYIDGTATAENTSTITGVTGVDTYTLGNLDDGSGPRLGLDGKMAEAVMHEDIAFTAAEAQAIAEGLPAVLIQTNLVVSYVPMIRGAPWNDTWRMVTGTIQDSVGVAEHPPFASLPGAQARVGIPTAAAPANTRRYSLTLTGVG